VNRLLYIFFIILFFLGYIFGVLGLPRSAATPVIAMLSGGIFALLALIAAGRHMIDIAPKYILLFFVLALFIFAGVIINSVSPGTVFWGLLEYLKYLPIFLLPAVYEFSESDLKNQLKLIFVLALIQTPLALFQRLFQFKGVLSGDVISGTLIISSALSIFMICVIAIVLAYYLRNQIKQKSFFILLFILFMPTTINETKGTLILLPIALMLPILFYQGAGSWLRKFMPIFLSATLLGGLFFSMYDLFLQERFETGSFDIVTDKNRMMHYLFSGEVTGDDFEFDSNPSITGKAYNELERDAPRLDSILISLILLSDEPTKLVTGLGIGNLNDSRLSVLSGEYSAFTDVYNAKITTLGQLLWETGIGGVIFSLIFLYMVFSDACYLRAKENTVGTLALGWVAVVAIIFISFPYKNLIGMNVIGYLFSYFSGYLAAARYRASISVENHQIKQNIS